MRARLWAALDPKYPSRECQGVSRQLLPADLGQVHAATAQLGWNRQVKIARQPEVFEVFGEKPVLAVVRGRALAKGLQELVAQNTLLGQHCCHVVLPFGVR